MRNLQGAEPDAGRSTTIKTYEAGWLIFGGSCVRVLGGAPSTVLYCTCYRDFILLALRSSRVGLSLAFRM